MADGEIYCDAVLCNGVLILAADRKNIKGFDALTGVAISDLSEKMEYPRSMWVVRPRKVGLCACVSVCLCTQQCVSVCASVHLFLR